MVVNYHALREIADPQEVGSHARSCPLNLSLKVGMIACPNQPAHKVRLCVLLQEVYIIIECSEG